MADDNITWEALNGVSMIPTGKTRRSGKPHCVLAINVLVVMTEADAKAMKRLYPRLDFVKRKGRPRATLRQRPDEG